MCDGDGTDAIRADAFGGSLLVDELLGAESLRVKTEDAAAHGGNPDVAVAVLGHVLREDVGQGIDAGETHTA